MDVLERTATVKMPIDRAEKFWTKFVAQQVVAQQSTGNAQAMSDGKSDPGTVYFNDAGNGKTEVTIRLDAKGIADADEATLNGRVDSYLDSFKQFAEQQ